MNQPLTVRILFSAVKLLSAGLICSGCRSAESGGGFKSVSQLVDPVPSQWEPPVETLEPSEIQESQPSE